jgi:anthranilate synthase component 1
MYRPDRATFLELARRFRIVPVWREVLADFQTPVAAWRRLEASGLGANDNGFLLESVEGGERWARYSFLGGDAFCVVKARDGEVRVEGQAPVVPQPNEPPLAYVRRLQELLTGPRLEGLPPLHGGAVGFLGYDCVRELERLPDGPPDELHLPDLALLLTRTFVVFDHFLQRAFVIANVLVSNDPSGDYNDALQRCADYVERLSIQLAGGTADLAIPTDPPNADVAVADRDYESWVEQCREHIYAGDVFQVVPSRRFSLPLQGSVFDAYRVLRALNPSPYMYFLRFGGAEDHDSFEIAGSSPEPLIRVTGDHVLTRPVAGTRRRGASEEEDVALEHDLLTDAKERAEHVMLVDLARNDVGRVAEWGTVSVDELMVVERYSHVMHIVSSVSGRLRKGLTPFDALTASFPAGTLTGAPKVRAMEIIDSLERTRRGPYSGVVGYFDFSGNLDTCITIRTIVASAGRAYVQAGAGIVADSVPEAEAEETRRKAEAPLRAVAAAALLNAQAS